VWEIIRSSLGEVTLNEVLLAGLVFACIVGFWVVPRAGEIVGGLFEGDDDE